MVAGVGRLWWRGAAQGPKLPTLACTNTRLFFCLQERPSISPMSCRAGYEDLGAFV